jgi:SSS family solute:Na+ symporter
MIWGAFLKMFIPILVLFPGMIASVTHPGLEDGDKAFPTLIGTLLPPGLGGLLFAALLAGLMSSIDSMLNSTATLWTKDIYQRFLKKRAPDEHYLFVGRIATVVLLVLGVITSPISSKYEGIYVAVQTYMSFFQGPTFSVLLLGIFWRRTTQWGGLSGLVGGLIVSLLLHIYSAELFTISDPFLYISWWSFVAGFVITVVVSLFTTPHSHERLYGFVYRLEKPTSKSVD